MRLPSELTDRVKTTMWVEGKQVRWNDDMPMPKQLIPGAFWITGDKLFYVDEEGLTRSLLGKVTTA